MVVHEEIVRLFLPEFLEGISPQDIAHQPVCRRFSETVNLEAVSKIVQRDKFGRRLRS